MEKHHRELARELFVFATELLEDTHSVATGGQSPKLTARRCRILAQKLAVAAQQMSTVAATLQALAAYAGPLPPIKPAKARKRSNKTSAGRSR